MRWKHQRRKRHPETKVDLVVALAGNANVGKSAIFNQLTGVDQIIGNWPGKTVERAEGLLYHEGYRIKVIDLPGIYSFSTFSMEELISREFIAQEKPDVVVNVVDATALERNLFFTIQLMELNAPIIIALNQIDLLERRGISVNVERLEELLGIPVVPTVAIKGKGIANLTNQILKIAHTKQLPPVLKYGREVEERIQKLTDLVSKVESNYSPRWIAIKLLERDPEIIENVKRIELTLIDAADRLAQELEQVHNEPSNVIITAERYHIANGIAKGVQTLVHRERTLADSIDKIALHPVLGYFLILLVIGGLLVWTFIIGAGISGFLANALSPIQQLKPAGSGPLKDILWNGALTGFIAGVTLVIPYVLPFYIILTIIEDSGYMTRISVMLDRSMHFLGLHGKAIIPLILGYGCSVPACCSCRIMETPKQKLLAAFLITLIPCTARTVVILGLVAAFVSIWWALGLYVFDIFIIILLGRIAFKAIPGEAVGLIMEMPEYHIPSVAVVLKQTWARTKTLFWIVFPVYILGSAVLQAIYAVGWLTPINDVLSGITVGWLGLPAVVGILLIFGVVRKELTILMLAVIFQTTNFSIVMTHVQLIVLALVAMFYIPCLATILVLAREFGWKKTGIIIFIEIGFAILIGGVASRFLGLIL